MVSGDFIINYQPVTRACVCFAIPSDVLFGFLYTSFVFVFQSHQIFLILFVQIVCPYLYFFCAVTEVLHSCNVCFIQAIRT